MSGALETPRAILRSMNPTSLLSPLLRNSVFRRRGRETGPVTLQRQRIFILPTRHGLLFGLLLLVMLAGSTNYNLSLGFAMTFLLAGLGLVSILHTHRNLSGLRLRPGRAEPVFAGQTARFLVHLENPGRFDRLALELVRKGARKGAWCDVPAGGAAAVELAVPADRRGLLQAGPFSLVSRFPLGLFKAWANVELDLACLIYPRPEAGGTPLPAARTGAAQGPGAGAGGEDFSTLRPYRPGDSPRHIAWKALAREQGVLTKEFSAAAGGELWLEWEAVAGSDAEARLSRLCRWVLEADAGGTAFGLRLPGQAIPPAQGDEHRRRCLEALARFGTAGRDGHA